MFYETRAAKAPVCYLEMAFHSDNEDAASVVNRPQAYAEAIAAGILAYFGINAQAPTPETQKPSVDLVPEDKRSELAQLMLTYALKSQAGDDPVPLDGWEGLNVLNPYWGRGKQLLAVRVSSRVFGPDKKSPKPTKALHEALKRSA